MAIQVSCPSCETTLKVGDELAGKKVRCKVCKEIFVVRGPRGGRDEDDERTEQIQALPRTRPTGAPSRRDGETEREDRRARDDRDDEDRGRRRRRDDDDRRRDRDRDRAKSGGAPVGLLLGVGAAVLLLLAGGVTGAIWYFSSNAPPPINPIVGGPVAAGDAAAVVPPPPGGGGGGPAIVGEPGARLRYRWNGGPHVYAVNVELEHDTHFQVHQGTCLVRAQQGGPRPAAPAEDRKGTGTGFVVNSNGYLVTCAHVVADATKVEVVIGGKTHPASVVVVDHNNDLAVIQINARDLPTLSLGNSDAVEVGQEVRALGFPLSSVLGDNIKATRGSLSGINTRDGRKVLQIDAAINPGNSGGPLVNENGEVIGINSSKLAGIGVSNVGFASPSNEAKKLLAGKAVTFAAGGWNVKLDGPTLVRRVSAATALITVTLGPGAGDAESYRLTCSGSLGQIDRPKPGVILGPRIPGFPGFRVPSTIEMDAAGNVQKASGGTQMPVLLGELGMFLVEPLPSDGRPSWETRGTCTITESSGGGFGGFGPRGIPRMPRPRFGPPGFGGPDVGKQRQATEHSTYTRGAAAGDSVTIKKHYELKCPADGTSQGLHLVTDSDITFDTRDGFPRGVALRGTLTVTKGNTTARLPITASYKLLTGAEREKILNPPPPPPSKPITEGDLPQLLTEVKSSNKLTASQAADKIGRLKPIDAKRDEVVKTLSGALGDSNTFVGPATIKALVVWANKEALVPILLPLVADKDVSTRREAINALVPLKDDRAIEPIGKRLSDPFDRSNVGNAMRAFGSKAEKAVVPHLASTDLFVRMEACRVLKDIGTSESKAALEKAANDMNRSVARYAREALDAIAKRK